MVPLGSLEITVRNKVACENMLMGTLFLKEKPGEPRRTYFIACISIGQPFFLETNSK
jgi:hypothetical protein